MAGVDYQVARRKRKPEEVDLKGITQIILSAESVTEMVEAYVNNLLGYSSKDAVVVDWEYRKFTKEDGGDKLVVTLHEAPEVEPDVADS